MKFRHTVKRLAVTVICIGLASASGVAQDTETAESNVDVDALISGLGARTFTEREAAEKQLRENFASAHEALQKAKTSNDPEIRWRATRILDDHEAAVPRTAPEVETPAQRDEGAEQRDDQRTTPRNNQREERRDRRWRDLDEQLRDLLDDGGNGPPAPVRPRQLEERPQEGFRQWQSEDGRSRGWSFRSGGEVPDDLWESLDRDMGGLREWRERLGVQLGENQRWLTEQWGEDPWAMLEDENLDAMVQQMLDSLDAQIEGLDLESLLGEDLRGFEQLLRPGARSARPRPPQIVSPGPRLGVRVEAASEVLQVQLGFSGGMVIAEVIGDSPAHRAGLQPHDIILSMDGRAIQSGAQLLRELERIGAGGEGDLEIVRRGSKRRLHFRLDE